MPQGSVAINQVSETRPWGNRFLYGDDTHHRKLC